MYIPIYQEIIFNNGYQNPRAFENGPQKTPQRKAHFQSHFLKIT